MNEAYGAQLSRSTRSMMFQHRCRRVVRNKAHFHGTLSSTTFPAAARQKPLTRCTSNGRLHLAFWRIRARRQSLIPGFEMGTQMLKVFSCRAQTCHLPALTASVRTTSTNASWSRKLSSDIVQTTSRTIVKVRRSTLKIPNTTFSLTLWTDTSKRDDYLNINTGYLQFDKTLLYSSAEDSSDEEDFDPNARDPQTSSVAPLEIPRQISSSTGSSSNSWTSSL